MSQTVVDDLEEGEIADDVVPEPILVEKKRSLPRRYTLNQKKKISKHKKNCKHSFQHHKQKEEKDLKNFKKHRKECPKHNVSSYPKSPVVKFKEIREVCRKVSLNDVEPKLDYSKFITKSAFKNFRSPPRKITKENSVVSSRLNESEPDNFPKLLSEYKKTQVELSRHKNNKDDKKNLANISNRKNDIVLSGESSVKHQPLDITSKLQSDDEDEEELRRRALASCASRPPIVIQNSTTNDASKENCLSDSGVIESDNYEVIDMEVDNENENVEIVRDLFVIDTTPSYFSEGTEIQPHICSFSPSDINTEIQINGFLPNLNNEPNENFNPEIFNNLYSSVKPILENPHFNSSHLDDEFEEELLRAELIANMNSARLRNKKALLKQNSFRESAPVCVNTQLSNHEKVYEEKRIVSIKNEPNKQTSTFNDRIINIENETNRKISTCNDRIVNIENEMSKQNLNDRIINIENENPKKESSFKEERTVSIVSEIPENKNSLSKTRSVFTVNPKQDFHNTVDSPVRKAVDIQVKLNVQSSTNSSIVSLPQERIVISLNNDSSSEDSDQEGHNLKKAPNTKSVVASLEALITNARHESDEKKDSSKNSSNSSDVVSCLSKAQQEEYNSLRKILAKKQPLFPQAPPQIKTVPNIAENSELILLKKKLLIAKKNLEKEKTLMNNTMKEVMKKKRSYMASKLKTQHLKEQLLAAEKNRKSELQLWTKCTSEFQVLKKSVTKREAIIEILQRRINALFSDFGMNGFSSPSNHTSDHNYNLSS